MKPPTAEELRGWIDDPASATPNDVLRLVGLIVHTQQLAAETETRLLTRIAAIKQGQHASTLRRLARSPAVQFTKDEAHALAFAAAVLSGDDPNAPG